MDQVFRSGSRFTTWLRVVVTIVRFLVIGFGAAWAYGLGRPSTQFGFDAIIFVAVTLAVLFVGSIFCLPFALIAGRGQSGKPWQRFRRAMVGCGLAILAGCCASEGIISLDEYNFMHDNSHNGRRMHMRERVWPPGGTRCLIHDDCGFRAVVTATG